MSTFDPTAIAGLGHNAPPEPAYLAIFEQIDDLFAEATNFADGEPISSQPIADAMTELHDKLHALGKQADELRVEEKKPLDEAVAAVQARFNPYIQPKKGKVDLAKSALGALLTPWRAAKTAAAQVEATRIAAEAEAATLAAQEAIRQSSGNLAARADAEELLLDAKKLEKTASRSWRAATVGTGLRTSYRADLVNIDEALDHYWKTHKSSFEDMVRELAAADVRFGVRTIPGFNVVEVKSAS
jgi:hypothetical protein